MMHGQQNVKCGFLKLFCKNILCLVFMQVYPSWVERKNAAEVISECAN